MAKQLDLDIVTSYTLKIGVVTSILLILTGIILLFTRNGGMGYSLSYLSNYTSTLSSSGIDLSGIPQGIFSLDGIYYITLGLWILIFTPISVVVIAIIDFFREKNRLYLIMSIIVLFNLFFAMIIVPRLIL